MSAGFAAAVVLKPCPFGLGLFAAEPIARGTLLWQYEAGTNVRTFSSEIQIRDRLAQVGIETVVYPHVFVLLSLNLWLLCPILSWVM